MRQYYNLPASLPYIDYDSESYISMDEFLGLCQPWLDSSDLEVVAGIASSGTDYLASAEQMLPEYVAYERGLRIALATIRAGKLQREFVPDVSVSTGGEIEKVSSEAMNQSDPLTREQTLDRYRWAKLDQLVVGHFFDIIYLAVYGLKLRLLQRKNCFTRQLGSDNFSAAYTAVWAEIENHVPKTESGANT